MKTYKLCSVCLLLIVMIVIGCMLSCRQEDINHSTSDTTKTEDGDTTIETFTKIETETDEEGYIDRATKPVETEIETEAETEIETETELETEIEPLFYLSDYERWVAECMVMGESGNEPYEGQILVAQCILNACLKDGLQPSEVRIEYKYSGWSEKLTDSVKSAVSEVFDDGYKITDEFILYFYAPKYSEGRFHETQRFITEVGGHRFFAEWDD